MKKRIRLTEEQIKKAINEISYGKVKGAYTGNEHLFWELKNKFDDFYDALFDIAGFYRNNNDGKTYTKMLKSNHDNVYIRQIVEYAEAIQEILEKKEAQAEKFEDEMNKVDINAYYNDESNEMYIDDMELRDAQRKYPN